MIRTPVSSSNVCSVGYDESSMTLEIEFNNGAIYQYQNVPQDIFNNLMSAASPGGFIHSSIKGVYAYERIV